MRSSSVAFSNGEKKPAVVGNGFLSFGDNRILRDHHEAEDAFQATFLVLVRKAASIVPRQMVGNWLYGVAYQTAIRARTTAAKRRARERQVSDVPEATAPPANWDALEPLLDQELTRLPSSSMWL